MPILRHAIHPDNLPVLARAQWNLAAHIMRRAHGGDLIAKVALYNFRRAAEMTDSLVELQRMTGGQEIYIVAFWDNAAQTYTDRHIIDWAIEFTEEDDPENSEFAQLREEWFTIPADDWKEWGR